MVNTQDNNLTPKTKGSVTHVILSLIITVFFCFADTQIAVAESLEKIPSNVYAPDTTATDRLPIDPPEPVKKKWWQRGPFSKPEPPPPDEELIINVGPRSYAPREGTLLRIPRPITSNTGAISPGFYLVQFAEDTPQGPLLELFYGRRLYTAIPLFESEGPPPEPVEPLYPNASPNPVAKAEVIEDGRYVQITYFIGEQRFQTAPLPIQLDPRPQLKY